MLSPRCCACLRGKGEGWLGPVWFPVPAPAVLPRSLWPREREKPCSAQGCLCSFCCSSRTARSVPRLPSSNLATPSVIFQGLEPLLSGQGYRNVSYLPSHLCVGLHTATDPVLENSCILLSFISVFGLFHLPGSTLALHFTAFYYFPLLPIF